MNGCRLVLGYRRAIHWEGVRTGGWLLAVSPLSYRGGIAVSPDETDPGFIRTKMIETLKELAKEESLPLCFHGIEERDTATRAALLRAGLSELFLFSDMVLPVLWPCLKLFANVTRRTMASYEQPTSSLKAPPVLPWAAIQ